MILYQSEIIDLITDCFLLSRKILYNTKSRASDVTMMRKVKNPMTPLSLSERGTHHFRFLNILLL